MSCTSEQLAVLNQKHSATEAGDGMTATIHYGAYKNCGRWNHNTSRIAELLAALTGAGLDVQLQHDQAETEDEASKLHGYVGVMLNGTLLCEEESVQHNRSYGLRREILATMAETVIEAARKQAADATATTDDAIAEAVQGLTVAAGADSADGVIAAPTEEGATCLLERPKPAASL